MSLSEREDVERAMISTCCDAAWLGYGVRTVRGRPGGLGALVTFCNPFDASLAASGPAAVFLPDREGALRFDPSWTRDCWGRAPGPHEAGWTWILLRDRGTGFVMLALVTSPTLLVEHPRLEVRAFAALDEANAVRASFGSPPIAKDPWC
jgi:hypothetical protein